MKKEQTSDNPQDQQLNIAGVNGCASDEEYYDEEYWEEEPNTECEKCGRTYDDIGYDYQYCKACGWDADNKKWDKPTEPTNADIEMGEAYYYSTIKRKKGSSCSIISECTRIIARVFQRIPTKGVFI